MLLVPSRVYRRAIRKALSRITRGLSNSNFSTVCCFLGRDYFRYQEGDFDRALSDFTKVIELNPGYADAYMDRGIVRGLKGDIHGPSQISAGGQCLIRSLKKSITSGKSYLFDSAQ
jgi:hypothetical protein